MSTETSPQIPVSSPQAREGLSLQARMVIAIIAVSVLTAIAIGYFSFARSKQVSDYLSDQFQESLRTQAESTIFALLEQEAQRIDQIFSNIERSADLGAAYAGNLLGNENVFLDASYWDAAQELRILPNGGRDNSNTEPGAVFTPAYVAFDEETIRELNAAIHLDFFAPDLLASGQQINAIYYISARGFVIHYPNIDLADLMPADFRATEQPSYTIVAPENDIDISGAWTPPYQGRAPTGLIVTRSHPVYDRRGQFRGVIGVDMQLEEIAARVLQIQVGQSGYAFLIDPSGRIIALPEAGYADFGLTPEEVPANAIPRQTIFQIDDQALLAAFIESIAGGRVITRLNIGGSERYFACAPVASTNHHIGVVVPVNEMNTANSEVQERLTRETNDSIQYGIILFGFVLAGAVLVSFIVSRVLTNPLKALTDTARRVAAGDFSASAPADRPDEIGQLAHTFNSMTAELQGMMTNLEQRVAERTADLANANQNIQRRANQFAAVAQIGKAIISIENLSILLSRVTILISDQLGFYHVGVFLNDEDNRFTVLQAANSDGGHRMLERGHRLEIGLTGIVGNVADTGKPRIALDTGADTVFFNNPDLPETRSEMALPLRIGERVIGVLDVQSTEKNVFRQEDIEILSVLADQISIAIENTRLLQETRRAFAEVQNTYRQYIRQEWQAATVERKTVGYRYAAGGAVPLAEPVNSPEVIDTMITGQTKIEVDGSGQAKMAIPIQLRGETIGTVNVRSNILRAWNQDEVDIARAAAERVALALENARLLSAAQRRAAKERTIGEISAHIGSLVDIDNILQTAAHEMNRMLPGSEVVIQFQQVQKTGGKK